MDVAEKKKEIEHLTGVVNKSMDMIVKFNLSIDILRKHEKMDFIVNQFCENTSMAMHNSDYKDITPIRIGDIVSVDYFKSMLIQAYQRKIENQKKRIIDSELKIQKIIKNF